MKFLSQLIPEKFYFDTKHFHITIERNKHANANGLIRKSRIDKNIETLAGKHLTHIKQRSHISLQEMIGNLRALVETIKIKYDRIFTFEHDMEIITRISMIESQITRGSTWRNYLARREIKKILKILRDVEIDYASKKSRPDFFHFSKDINSFPEYGEFKLPIIVVSMLFLTIITFIFNNTK